MFVCVTERHICQYVIINFNCFTMAHTLRHEALVLYHRWRSYASPVLTAISLVNGKPWEPVIFDPPQNR